MLCLELEASCLAGTRYPVLPSTRRVGQDLPKVVNQRELSDPLTKNAKYATAGSEKLRRSRSFTPRAGCPALWRANMGYGAT